MAKIHPPPVRAGIRHVGNDGFDQWAVTPPMGWNSYTSFGGSVTEAEVLANAGVMKDKFLRLGWEYVVIDISWYDRDAAKRDAEGSRKNVDYPLTADAFGRLLPAPEFFPSAVAGQGFKPLADKIHGMGLKFGIHIMRGIPRQAVAANAPIEGSNFTATDAAASISTCGWCSDMYGVNNNAAGQAYYDSLLRLYATWGIDFIKVDDLTKPYSTHEVEMVRAAIDKCGRRIVFSASPGETPVTQMPHVVAHANMWRVSADFWDSWKQLQHQFGLAAAWGSAIGNGHWPDLDLLILGHVGTRSCGGPRMTRFTRAEQRTVVTLWCIARSPLMIGANLPQNDALTDALFTNKEVLTVNQHSTENRQLFRRGDMIAWIANVPDSADRYVALFNLGDRPLTDTPVSVSEAGLTGSCRGRDLWCGGDVGVHAGVFRVQLPPHGAGLYRLSP